ncbi:glycosyltransferase [Pedobacter sp. Leaf170]|uniref:glycosyltransferase n=1 Tax=Pedobacter sp. Leaf170 TaxID=2876558 RepID=UPI001E291477|nr:glycosyltransferase [Pedobacter sp. Leaf170]
MQILIILFFIIQTIIASFLVVPFLMFIVDIFNGRENLTSSSNSDKDYAIIVTAYQQTTLLNNVVNSILNLNYSNYIVYVVADNCDISNLHFNSDKVILLRPEETLAGNTKSHFYAINKFVRPHEILTIIDSDNLVDGEYLNELNVYFNKGFQAVQGVRAAKNLNTAYACLDAASDIFYRFIDRKLLYSVGSSAALSGSGMAFTTTLYRECLEHLVIDGAGFDKVLQLEIQNRDLRVAFAEKAIVYDEKTSKSDQLVKQRSRWMFTWFKYASGGLSLISMGIKNLSWNQFIYGVFFVRPPLFLLGILSILFFITDIILFPLTSWFWIGSFVIFIFTFLLSLVYFKAPKEIYKSLISIPLFIFFQIISLFKSKNANKISVATEHYQIIDNQSVKKS